MFNGKPVADLDVFATVINLAPSSCDRKAVRPFFVEDRTDKEFLGGVLVGGVGWIHRAGVIVLLVADWSAYKEGLEYMPYLDAGVIVQALYMSATALGYKCCYVNPNIRKEHQDFFREKFNLNENDIFCGAMAIGYEEK